MGLELQIIFKKEIDIAFMKDFIATYWPKGRLEADSGTSKPDDTDWGGRVSHSNEMVTQVYIFKEGGDDWFWKYPRSLEGYPGMWFKIDERPRPKQENVHHLFNWPIQILNSKTLKKIMFFDMDWTIEYYSSFDELVKAIYCMRFYSPSLRNYTDHPQWEPTLPKIDFDSEKIDEFKKIVLRFLNSPIANNSLYIECINDAYVFMNHTYAQQTANKNTRGTDEDYDLLRAFLEFEENEQSRNP